MAEISIAPVLAGIESCPPLKTTFNFLTKCANPVLSGGNIMHLGMANRIMRKSPVSPPSLMRLKTIAWPTCTLHLREQQGAVGKVCESIFVAQIIHRVLTDHL